MRKLNVEPKLFNQQCGNYRLPVGDHGHIGYISGLQGSMKSTVIRYWAAAALSGESHLTFDFSLQDRCVIMLDGEQPPDIYDTSVQQIFTLCNKTSDDRLITKSLQGADWREKQQYLFDTTFKHRRELGLVLIDGGKNFIGSSNDELGCKRFVGALDSLAKRSGCIVIVLSHLSESNGKTRLFGWLGSILHDLSSFGYRTQRSGKYFGLEQVKQRYAKTSPVFFSYGREKGLLETLPYWPY